MTREKRTSSETYPPARGPHSYHIGDSRPELEFVDHRADQFLGRIARNTLRLAQKTLGLRARLVRGSLGYVSLPVLFRPRVDVVR